MCLTSGHLGEPVLLPVWLPLPGLHHSGGVLLPDQHRHGLFPAVCRGTFTHTHSEDQGGCLATVSTCSFVLSFISGLQMVVENVPGVWRFRLLRPHLRRLLLCQQGKVLTSCSEVQVDQSSTC